MQSSFNHPHKYVELCAKTFESEAKQKSSLLGSQPAEITKKLDESIPFLVPQSDSKYPHWTYQLRTSKICWSAVTSVNLQPILQGGTTCSEMFHLTTLTMEISMELSVKTIQKEIREKSLSTLGATKEPTNRRC